MKREYHLKSSDGLYGKSPLSWMFKPYYSAIIYKESLASGLLENELERNYMERDNSVINKQYRAKKFNAGLRDEMDHVLNHLGIKDAENMWAEMEECIDEIYKKYASRKIQKE